MRPLPLFDIELPHVLIQDCPIKSASAAKGNCYRGIRLGHWHLGNWINSASAPTDRRLLG